jgi:cytoskeletal protein RodZ
MRNRDNSGGQQKDYLNAEDTAGRPMALASILFTLLFIAAIALLLFSAGRWAYGQMIDEEVTVSTTQQEEAKTEDTNNGDVAITTNPDNTTSTETTVTTTAPSESASESTATTTGSTASNGATDVPNTGPGSLVGIFIVTVILATLIHYRFQIVKNR